MTIQGSAQRVLDSVLPHEITHMIFASYFRRPLPRWADEGGATSVEHVSEKQKHRQMLVQFLHTGRGIAFGQMFAMTEYPQDVMPLYAQGYSLAEYLIYRGGRKKFVAFLSDGMNDGQWSAAIQRNYNIRDLSTLQDTWVAWVAQGFPPLRADSNVMTAAVQTPARQPVAATPAASCRRCAASTARAEPDLPRPRQAGWKRFASGRRHTGPDAAQRSIAVQPRYDAECRAGFLGGIACETKQAGGRRRGGDPARPIFRSDDLAGRPPGNHGALRPGDSGVAAREVRLLSDFSFDKPPRLT